MAAAVSYLQSADATSAGASSWTFTGQNVGTAAADRKIIVIAMGRKAGASVESLTGVTVGGVTATQVVKTTRSGAAGGGAANAIGIYEAALPSGTTGDVVVTFSGNVGRCIVSLFRATGIDASHASAADNAAAEDPSASINVPVGGIAIGGCLAGGSGSTSEVWAGLTENVGALSGSFTRYSAASDLFASAQSPLAITCNLSAPVGDTTAAIVGVFASWSPTAGSSGNPYDYFEQEAIAA